MTVWLTPTLLVALVLGTATHTNAGAEPQSAALAKQLAAVLAAQKTDVIAARDPANPARFVAALYIPQSELLVVAAEFADASPFNWRLENKQYRDLYLDLSASPIRMRPVFFEDLGADGLCSDRSQLPDTMHESGNTQTVFDGDWGKRELTREKHAAADRQYSHLLTVLLSAAQGSD